MRYHFNHNYIYSVDLYTITFVHQKTNETLMLGYPEAAIVDLLFKEYPTHKLIRLLSRIGHYTENHAAGILNDTIKLLAQHKIILEK